MTVTLERVGTDKQSVAKVVKLCEDLGLDVGEIEPNGHRKVRDPESGAYLFSISSSPSDPNWFYMIRRHLRRLGLVNKAGHAKNLKRKSNKKHFGSIDLDALAKAQAEAEAAGHRAPQLSDIAEGDTEFFKRVRMVGTGKAESGVYTNEGQDEVIDNMTAKADAPRVNYTRTRLEKVLAQYGPELIERAKRERRDLGEKGGKITANAEFMKVAEMVGRERDLRIPKTLNAGLVTLRAFQDGKDVALWMINLLEATMDKLEGLKWGVQPTQEDLTATIEEKVGDGLEATVEPGEEMTDKDIDEHLAATTPQMEPTVALATKAEFDDFKEQITNFVADSMIEEVAKIRQELHDEFIKLPETLPATLETTDPLREKYAETLFKVVEKMGGHGYTETLPTILDRLDRLVGIDATTE